MKPDESIKAEEIDGYRGGEDLESLLQFIESKPKSRDGSSSQNPDPLANSKSKPKRSRRTDRKSKRSRTPSVTTSNKEKSPDVQSQKTSRASSVAPSVVTTKYPENSKNSNIFPDNPENSNMVPDSITTVKMVNKVNNNAKVNSKKPKKQAGWLVDLTSEPIKTKVKSKPPSGLKPIVNNNMNNQVETETILKEVENKNELLINEDSSEPNSVQDEIIMTPEEDNIEVDIEEHIEEEDDVTTTDDIMDFQKDVCLNYSSILKFIKQGEKSFLHFSCCIFTRNFQF